MTATRTCPRCGSAMPGEGLAGPCPACRAADAQADRPTGISTTPHAMPPAVPAPEELARFFPQLEIQGLLGQGGMGAVYLARQPRLDRLVALKVLPPAAAQDPAFAARFTREARALARLSHPHIVAVHDFGDSEGLYYFLMEYVDGLNLRQRLQAGPVAPDEVRALALQLCDALEYAHEEGVIHRDVKPENILIDRRGRVKVADFGLVKILGESLTDLPLTASRQVMGTLFYMAPEQIERPLEVDHRADIYSLGVVLYELLTGGLPLGRFALPSEKAALDRRWDEVILRALAKEPERRYRNVRDLRAALEELGPVPPGRPRPVSEVPTAVEWPVEALPAEPAGAADQEQARRRLRIPAVGLEVTGTLIALWWPLCTLAVLLAVRERGPICGFFGLSVLGGLQGIVLLLAARDMRHRRNYGGAILAAMIGMLPLTPAVIPAILFGLWALWVLRRPEVAAAFGGGPPCRGGAGACPRGAGSGRPSSARTGGCCPPAPSGFSSAYYPGSLARPRPSTASTPGMG